MSSPSVASQQPTSEPTWLAISPKLITVLLLAVLTSEFVLLFFGAEIKNIYWDELYTWHVSSLRPFSLLWKALQLGIDTMPPGYYGLIMLARKLPGEPNFQLRLPSILGYVLTLLGVYWFVRKRFSPLVALSAVLFLSLLPYRQYAIEARSYAALVGLLAVSAALWQRADEKWWAKPLLAVCLPLAVAMHYFAVVVMLGFGMAELAFSWTSRRLRWSVWSIFVIASIPFFLNLPLLLGLRTAYGKHLWSKTSWGTALATYGHIFDINPNLALVGIGVFGLTVVGILLQKRRNPQKDCPQTGFSLPEIFLIAGFLIFPTVLVVVAKVAGSGSGYTDRYGWPAILGFVLGLVFLAGNSWTKPAAARVLAALLLVFFLQAMEESHILIHSHRPDRTERWSRLTKFSNTDPSLPVVLDSIDLEMELMHFPAPELRQRMVRVVDREVAASFTGTDGSEVFHLLARQFLSWPVEDSATFLAAHKKFFVQSDMSIYNWLVPYLIEKKYHLTILWQNSSNLICLAER